MDVPPQPAALAADDEQRLAVRLQADQAVHDVRPGLLQLAGPLDVRPLVEARLDLDQDHDLLAPLRGANQVVHDPRIERRSIERLLDREDVGIVGGLLDEALDARREALVGVVHEQVALSDGGEDVGGLVLVDRLQAGRDHGRPRCGPEIRAVQVGELPQAREVEHAPDLVGLIRVDAEAAAQDVAHLVGHRTLDLEANGLTEPATPELLLDRDHEIARVLLIQRDIGITRHPEQVVAEDLHAAEQDVQVRADDLVDEGVAPSSELVLRLPRQLDEARQHGGHLDPREAALVRLRVTERDGDR